MGIISRTQIFLSRDFPRGRHEVPPEGEVKGEKIGVKGDISQFQQLLEIG